MVTAPSKKDPGNQDIAFLVWSADSCKKMIRMRRVLLFMGVSCNAAYECVKRLVCDNFESVDITLYITSYLPVITEAHLDCVAFTVIMSSITNISAVHRAGYIFGDFNPMNIGVNINDGTVAFFDADTYHFKDNCSGHTHRCKAGCPGYVAPELIATCRKYSISHPGAKDAYAHAPLPTFTLETDNFALSIHIFKLLMNGYTPYNGIPETSSVSLASPGQGDVAVERNNYCFAPGKKPMSSAMPEMSSLPSDVQALFLPVTICEWSPTHRPVGQVAPTTLPRTSPPQAHGNRN